MPFVCDAPGGKTWFQIETEAEAALESALMQHAVEKHFRQAREHAKMSYVPPSGAYIEQDIGLKAHLQRVMPVLLTLRDQDGNGLATAMLPPASQDVRSVRPVSSGLETVTHTRSMGQRFGFWVRTSGVFWISCPQTLTLSGSGPCVATGSPVSPQPRPELCCWGRPRSWPSTP